MREALAEAKPTVRDRAAVALAWAYAGHLDDSRGTEFEIERHEKVGPKYLAALTALGLTPAGRGQKGVADSDQGTTDGKVDELRQRRAKRSAGLDPAANLD